MAMRKGEDPRYMSKTQLKKQSVMLNKEASKTTLKIMNVTFNTRPGVKQYINAVAGKRALPASQLPTQGQR